MLFKQVASYRTRLEDDMEDIQAGYEENSA